MFKQRRGWTLKEQAMLLRHLADLLGKGYTLKRALEFLQLYVVQEKQEQLQQSVLRLKTGRSLYDVFRELKFHSDMLGYLFFAERHGDVVLALRQGSVLLERKQQRADKLRSALRYPLFLLVFFLVILFLFNTILLPQFSGLYASVQTTPHSSSVLFSILQSIPAVCMLLFLLVLSGAGYYKYRFVRLPVEVQMTRMLRIPFLCRCVRALNSHAFSMQMSSLLQGGLSVFDALVLMEQQRDQHFLRHEAARMKRSLTSGEELEDLLRQRPYYEPELVYVVTHGQANGTLAAELADYGEMTLSRLETSIAAATAAIQPVFFLIIGLLVVLLYMAIMLPMFNMMQGI